MTTTTTTTTTPTATPPTAKRSATAPTTTRSVTSTSPTARSATPRSTPAKLTRVLLTATAIGLSLGLAACGPSRSTAPGSAETDPTPSAGVPADSDGSEAAPLVWEDGWIKAAEDGMTGAFGTLRSSTGSDLRITGAESAAAGSAELHETASDDGGSTLMQEKEGGFLVPAGASLTLEPGGDHIMLMELREPILPGDEVTITLLTDAGEVEAKVVAKEFSGAQEEYVQDPGH